MIKDGDIEITFTNAGDKIPGDMLQTIFEKFYRVDDSRSTEPAAQVSDLQSPNRLWSCTGAEFWQKVMTIRRSLS